MIDPLAGSDLSRRSLVKTAATAAAVGGALTLAGPAAGAEAATAPAEATTARTALPGQNEPGTGVLVRVLDPRLGTLEIYTEHGHRTITDRALTVQLARLAH